MQHRLIVAKPLSRAKTGSETDGLIGFVCVFAGPLGATAAREATEKARLCSADAIHLPIQPVLQRDRAAGVPTRTSAVQGRPLRHELSGSALQGAVVHGELDVNPWGKWPRRLPFDNEKLEHEGSFC